jgi:competence/damage-inducible protein CinA-like protein
MPAAEILTIGTEILLGEIVDTNTRFIARAFRAEGIDLYRTVTVGDNVERISEAIREALPRAEIILTTGGLGPTVDDPTRLAIARAMGLPLEFREDLWKTVQQRLAQYGKRLAGENQKRQAYVPKGARILENPVGTAPAFIVETERHAIIALPGVPREMETLLTNAVLPYLRQRYDLNEIIKVRILHTSGVGEGIIDEKIGDLEKSANPTVGLTAHAGAVDIRLAAKASNEEAADAMIAEMEAEIRARLGAMIFGADEETLTDAAAAALARRNWSLLLLEYGLEGHLIRLLQPFSEETRILPSLHPGELLEKTEAARRSAATDAALGVALFPGEMNQTVELCLLSPEGKRIRRLTYGGHPRNAPHWAANLALDLLRRAVTEEL